MASKFRKIAGSKDSNDREQYFEEVYNLYFTKLYAYSKAIVDSQSLAKDIVSDLFFNFWNNKTDFRDFQEIEMYLYISVRNLSIQALKKQKRFESAENLEIKLETIDYVDPQELLLEKELMAVVEESISQLPDHCQLVFNLMRQRNMKNAEIAEELGISVVTVKSQLRKAQKKLRADIVRYYHDKEGSHLPDVRLIGQYLLALGLTDFEFFS